MENIVKIARGGGTENKRNSSIELLRILTMICIIAHHYIVNSGVLSQITPMSVLSANSLFALIFGWGGKTGINCFVLITGYFMCKSDISIKKFLKIFLEIEFYELLFFIIFAVSGYETFSLKAVIKMLVPIYYIGTDFSHSYLIFFWFFPYLNLLIKNMDEKLHRNLIVTCILADTILQTFLKAPVAFTYVGWFITLYFIAAYIRKYSDGEYNNIKLSGNFFNNKKLWGTAAIISLLLSWGSVIAGSWIYSATGKNIIYSFVSDSNKLLALITSVTLFLYFKNLNLGYNKLINIAAASTFGVLMIHANSDSMRRWLWTDVLYNVGAYNSVILYFVCHAIISVLSVYIICTLLDMLRIKFIEEPLFRWFSKTGWINKSI